MQEARRDETAIGPDGLVRRVAATTPPRYSICTLVTRWDEYAGMAASFQAHGFGAEDCEYLTIDNSERNVADGYRGLNAFLLAAAAPFIVLVHQDVILLDDGRRDLDAALAALTAQDPHWGVCGNAGHTDDGWPAFCLSHPFRDPHVIGGPFPTRVVSLDENFIVARREANLAVSRDLAGFHHYGVDLCLVADLLGWSAYVIGFYLRHNSGGTFDATYDASQAAIVAKYARALRPRWVHLVTRRSFFVSGRPAQARIAGWLRTLGKLTGRVPRYHHLDDERRRARRDRRRARTQPPR